MPSIPIRVAIASASLIVAGSAHAADADLEARIAALEAQLEALKAEVRSSREELELQSEALVAQDVEIEEVRNVPRGTRFRYGGYVQLDALASEYSDGQPGSLMEDIFVPADIPVAPAGVDADPYRSTNMHAKTSRFFFDTQTTTDAGVLSSKIELDFIASAQGDERVTNSFASRIRLAYVDWEYAPGQQLRAGQDWSTFVNTAALPDLIDLVGPVGVAFDRQALLRWTSGPFQLALENETSVISAQDGDRLVEEGQLMPDIVARYNGESGDLRWSLSAIGRRLNYSDRASSAVETREDSEFGYGLSLAGKWYLGRDDLRFMVNYGDALGRYMGLNAFNDAYIDNDGDLATTTQWGGYLAYRHYWNDQWRSNLSVSVAESDNPGVGEYALAEELARSYRTFHVNLNYLPAPDMQLGTELILGTKELESGRSGDLLRLQFGAKFAF